MGKYSKEEIETIINFNLEEKTADVYSADPRYIQKMEKLAEAYPEQVKVVKKDDTGASFKVPKKWVKVRPPRQISDEQRVAAAERLKSYRENSGLSK